MKKLLITLSAVLIAAVSAHAQGTIQLITRGLTGASGTYDAAFTAGTGVDFTGANAELFLVGGTASAPTYTALQPVATLSSSGKVGAPQQVLVTVPGVAAGQTAQFALAAFKGTDYSSATVKSGYSQTFTSGQLGGTPAVGLPITPPDLSGLAVDAGGAILAAAGGALTITGVPEPTTIALGLLGVGALLLRRRK